MGGRAANRVLDMYQGFSALEPQREQLRYKYTYRTVLYLECKNLNTISTFKFIDGDLGDPEVGEGPFLLLWCLLLQK